MNSFSAIDRPQLFEHLQTQTFDLLVVGGGITGAGIALDAASRGLSVALIEMQDFAGGTSSRSTRLIHGGLRYLKQLEFGLVSEVAKERKIIFRNAPHLVKPEPILLPITKTGSLGKTATRLAMLVYELLAGVKKEERHRYLNADETFSAEPFLNRDELLGGILYYEYRTDDARLTLAVLKKAVSQGAAAVSYTKAVEFLYDHGKITGLKAMDQVSGKACVVKARFVVNAAGPWADDLDGLDKTANTNKLQLTKGVHIVVDQVKLPLKQAVYFDTADKRMVFALPHRGKVYIGTTDTFYSGEKVNPPVTQEDKNYLLTCVNTYFSGSKLVLADIESCWAGIRPLIKKAGKKPSEISRKDEIFEWPSGLITIAGGKLSGYRKMAQRIVDLISSKISTSAGSALRPCTTASISLSGGNEPALSHLQPDSFKVHDSNPSLEKKQIHELFSFYGQDADKVIERIIDLSRDPSVSPDLPVLLHAKLTYAINHEMCLSPADFFIRRTGMLYFEKENVNRYKKAVITKMREILKWDEAQSLRYENELEELINLSS